MTQRPNPNGPKGGGTYADKAQERWAGAPPDYVQVLAQAADAEVARGGNQATLAKRIGMRSDMISALIGKSYAGNYAAAEQIVRGKLMNAKVDCPALADSIARDECLANQQRKQFTAANPLMVALSRACPTCPHNMGAKS